MELDAVIAAVIECLILFYSTEKAFIRVPMLRIASELALRYGVRKTIKKNNYNLHYFDLILLSFILNSLKQFQTHLETNTCMHLKIHAIIWGMIKIFF